MLGMTVCVQEVKSLGELHKLTDVMCTHSSHTDINGKWNANPNPIIPMRSYIFACENSIFICEI